MSDNNNIEDIELEIAKLEKIVMGKIVMGTGTWVWVPVFMAIFLLYF